VLLFPLPAHAQQSFSLPSIGLPLPAIGLQPGLRSAPWEQRQMPSWERPQIPEWERNRIPPWEKGYVPNRNDQRNDRSDRNRRRTHVPYAPVYYVPYPVAVPQPEPQVIVVQPPPVVVTVEVAARETRAEAERIVREPEPEPFVPSGDRTVYVIPGCYVGNVPPKDVKLPPGCDLKKLTTFHP
jgi:hypothetical protein